MAKIFIVTSGEYSSYAVNAAFSTREKAEAYIGERWSSLSIEEFEIDAYDNHVHRNMFSVCIDLENGDMYDEFRSTAFVSEHKRSEIENISDLRNYGTSDAHRAAFRSMGNKPWRYGRISARVTSYVSMEHVFKLAAEARQKWLRENAQEMKEQNQ